MIDRAREIVGHEAVSICRDARERVSGAGMVCLCKPRRRGQILRKRVCYILRHNRRSARLVPILSSMATRSLQSGSLPIGENLRGIILLAKIRAD